MTYSLFFFLRTKYLHEITVCETANFERKMQGTTNWHSFRRWYASQTKHIGTYFFSFFFIRHSAASYSSSRIPSNPSAVNACSIEGLVGEWTTPGMQILIKQKACDIFDRLEWTRGYCIKFCNKRNRNLRCFKRCNLSF